MNINTIAITTAANCIRAINHQLRQDMLKAIHDQKSMTVKEIQEKWSLHQSETSQHLAILRKNKFVNTERIGKHIRYSVNEKYLELVNSLFQEIDKNVYPR